MQNRVLGILAIACAVSSNPAFGQAPPKAAIDISAEEIKTVRATGDSDRMVKIVDLGPYQLGIGVQKRASNVGGARGGGGGAAPAAGAARGAAPAAPAAAPVPCGPTGTPSPNAQTGALTHDSQTETYIIIAGGGTLVTGGSLVNARRNDPNSDVVKLLNGPTCSGVTDGPDVLRRDVKAGDIIIIPAGVPHAWGTIPEGGVEYMVVRTDAVEPLPNGYVHPSIKK